MNIWRINCKPGKQILSQKDQFKFWIENGFVGIGWSSDEGFDKGYIPIANSNYSAGDIKNFIYNGYREKKEKTQGFSTASNIFVNRMEKEDFIWVRCGNIYKLGKIKSEGLYNFNSKIFSRDRQIGFYRKVEYLDREFSESEVPGKIVASYRTRSTVQKVDDYNDMMWKYCASCFSGENISIPVKDWNSFLHSSDIEEIIGLYLQVEKKLYVYTSTNKNDTAKIEFELVNNEGKRYGVQVKSGDTSLNALDFKDISKLMKIYLFAANDRVNNLEHVNNIEKIEVAHVTEFIENNLHILPQRIRFWFKSI